MLLPISERCPKCGATITMALIEHDGRNRARHTIACPCGFSRTKTVPIEDESPKED